MGRPRFVRPGGFVPRGGVSEVGERVSSLGGCGVRVRRGVPRPVPRPVPRRGGFLRNGLISDVSIMGTASVDLSKAGGCFPLAGNDTVVAGRLLKSKAYGVLMCGPMMSSMSAAGSDEGSGSLGGGVGCMARSRLRSSLKGVSLSSLSGVGGTVGSLSSRVDGLRKNDGG